MAVCYPSASFPDNKGEIKVFELAGEFLPHIPFAAYTLTKPNPQAYDRFGTSIAFVGGSLVVGARGDDTTALDKGAAYVFGNALSDADGDGLLDLWEIAHFGSRSAHRATDDTDDTDGDGSSELAEMAFDQNPLSPDATAAPAPVMENGYLTMTITKCAGVNYVVQSAGTPADADFSATTTTVLTDNATTLKVRDNVPVGAEASRFLRVRVAPSL